MQNVKIPVFYYHSIGGPEPQTLSLSLFRNHLDLLLKHRVKTITFSQLIEGDYSPNEKLAVITFDDGLLDNFDNALPELIKRDQVGTFFCVPGYDAITRYVNPHTERWSDTPKSGYSIPFKSMTREHRRELIQQGMEIGSHTMTHRKLTQIEPREIESEIHGSKYRLEEELGITIKSFCYPNGKYDASIIRQVKQAGYKGATITWPGYANKRKNDYETNRFLIKNPYYFEQILLGKAFSAYSFLASGIRFGRFSFFQ